MKNLIIFVFLIISTVSYSQKVCTIQVIENNKVVTRVATLEEAVRDMEKTSIIYELNGNSNPVYKKGLILYAIIETKNGILKKRLAAKL